MNLPNIWGQGQLFAFSALDGDAYATNDFVGMLSGDRLGVRFYTKVIRELAVVGIETKELTFKAVTGDYICAVTGEKEEIIILYYDTNTIIGQISSGACPVVFVEGKSRIIEDAQIVVQDTGDGEFTTLAVDGNKFSFAYSTTQEDAVKKAQAGLKADIAVEVSKKTSYYEKHSLPDTVEHSKLYNKCLSVMKTQLYTPEGKFPYIWSTPNRLPHKDLWLWDSVFHAIGFSHLNGRLAEELILDVFVNQLDNGMIPHHARVGWCSNISQPPVIAWGAWKVYEITGNEEFLKEVFRYNGRFLDWFYNYRVCKGEQLFTWNTNEVVFNRCDESGVDNSPRFDDKVRLLAIDFACYMANEMRYMCKIAEVIGEDKQIYEQQFQKIKESVNQKLWDEEDGFYYDYNIDYGCLHKVEASSSFLPLFAGLCDEKQAEKLVGWLTNPETFCTEMPVPSLAKRNKYFAKDMWRGPVWINFNYMIIEGLKDYGYSELAEEIKLKTLNTVNQWYHRTGVVFEFFDCENDVAPYKLNRKGAVAEPYNIRVKYQAIRDFGWSCTLICDIIASGKLK